MVALVIFPFVSPNVYYVNLMSQILIFGVLALSLDMIWGYGGLLSFGQTAFFGLGAYTYAVATMNLMADVQIQQFRQYTVTFHPAPTYIPMLLAVAVPSALAAAIGWTLFYARAKGVYFAIITLADTSILEQLAIQSVKTRIGNIPIGGWNGIVQIPRFIFGIPGMFLYAFNSPVDFYLLVVVFTVGTYVVVRRILTGRFGKVLVAIRDNETRTEAFGYDVRRHKLIAFTVSGAVAGVAGMMFAAWGGFVNPDVFSFLLAAQAVVWVLIGGRGTMLGPFLGVFLVQLSEATLGSTFQYTWLLIIGVIFILFVLAFQRGVYPRIAAIVEEMLTRT